MYITDLLIKPVDKKKRTEVKSFIILNNLYFNMYDRE